MKLCRRDITVTAVAGVLCSALIPVRVQAHLVTTGMGPVYDGTGHLLLTPEDLIPVLAMGVYAGLQGRDYGRYALFFLPLSWFLAGLLGLSFEELPAVPYGSFSFLLFGILIAADARLSPSVFLLSVIAAGTLHGFFNGQAINTGPGVRGLVGITGAVFVLTAIVSALVHVSANYWRKMVLRVMGSWVAASGLLMIGWFFRS